MNRKDFIRSCGFACLAATPLSMFMESCTGSKMISARITGENIFVPATEFEVIKKGITTYRKFIVVQNEQLKFPICVYRFSDKEYTAIYMQCSHQGAELTVYGDKLVCSAHGSEFDNRGNVQSSPADKPLRTFLVSLEQSDIKISLKAS